MLETWHVCILSTRLKITWLNLNTAPVLWDLDGLVAAPPPPPPPPPPPYIFLFVIYLTVTILTKDKCRHLNMIGSFHGRYSNYVFISDQAIAQSAGMNSRYTDSSLHGVVFDIHMLSACDFLVCTFSSQVSGKLFLVWHTMCQRKVEVDMLNAVKSVLALHQSKNYLLWRRANALMKG